MVEHADTDAVIDLGDPGDSIGDQPAFGNPIYNAANSKQIGRDQGECFRTNPGHAWECTWTTYLADGSLTVQGPFLDTLEDSTLAITGGTGIYREARGEMGPPQPQRARNRVRLHLQGHALSRADGDPRGRRAPASFRFPDLLISCERAESGYATTA